MTYGAVALVAVITVALVLAVVPSTPGDPHATGRRELRAFREPQVWLTLLVGAVGFGGMFAMYSYIAPTVTEVTGQPRGMIPFFLLAFGVGAVAGTIAGGVWTFTLPGGGSARFFLAGGQAASGSTAAILATEVAGSFVLTAADPNEAGVTMVLAGSGGGAR